MAEFAEIRIVDFIEDPANDAAFGINFEVYGPGRVMHYVRVSFTEGFVEHYFRIPWTKDLASEEHRLEQERRELFIRWGLYRLERWVDAGAKEEKILVRFEEDAPWAERVEKGLASPRSQAVRPGEYVYYPRRT